MAVHTINNSGDIQTQKQPPWFVGPNINQQGNGVGNFSKPNHPPANCGTENHLRNCSVFSSQLFLQNCGNGMRVHTYHWLKYGGWQSTHILYFNIYLKVEPNEDPSAPQTTHRVPLMDECGENAWHARGGESPTSGTGMKLHGDDVAREWEEKRQCHYNKLPHCAAASNTTCGGPAEEHAIVIRGEWAQWRRNASSGATHGNVNNILDCKPNNTNEGVSLIKQIKLQESLILLWRQTADERGVVRVGGFKNNKNEIAILVMKTKWV